MTKSFMAIQDISAFRNALKFSKTSIFSKVDFRINRRPKSLPKVSDHAIDWERYIEHRKSSIRSKVEHVFRIIKCQFGYKKVVYRGLKKNENRLYALFACANLYSLAIAGQKLSTT